MSWNSELGIWKWGIFRGTTPRNADIWTLDIVVGKWELWIGTGPHWYMTFFSGPEEKWSVERNREDCKCYTCTLFRPPSKETWAAMVEAMKDAPHVHVGEESFRKCENPDKCQGMLPPRPSSSFEEDMHQPLAPELQAKLFADARKKLDEEKYGDGR